MFFRPMRIAAAAGAVFLVFMASAVRAGGASDLVAEFQAGLLNVMKAAEKSTVRQRYDQLAPAIESAFHVPLMTQIAVGRHWSAADPAHKTQLINAFRRMSISTLATHLDGYGGETFEMTGERPGPSKTTIVTTNLVKADKSRVGIAYVARQFSGTWRLIDIVIDNGISELKVRRSEYNQILRKSGVPGLIKLLNGKADDLMSQ